MLVFAALRSGFLDSRRTAEEELHTRADAAHRDDFVKVFPVDKQEEQRHDHKDDNA